MEKTQAALPASFWIRLRCLWLFERARRTTARQLYSIVYWYGLPYCQAFGDTMMEPRGDATGASGMEHPQA